MGPWGTRPNYSGLLLGVSLSGKSGPILGVLLIARAPTYAPLRAPSLWAIALSFP